MKKLLVMMLMVFVLFALAACGGNGDTPGTQDTAGQETPPPATQNETPPADTGSGGAELAFYQMRDNQTGKIVSLGDNISVFDEAFGEREFVSEGRRTFGTMPVVQRTYTYLDGRLIVGFDAEDNTALMIRLNASSDDVESGRFETFEVNLGMHQDDLVALEGFSSMQLAAGGVLRVLNAEGEMRTPVGAIRVGEYAASITIQDEVAVGILLSKGDD